jgi:DNA-binding beta-propeller fold protein YncE
MDRWKLDPCHVPTSMAIDTANHRLFVGCHNKMLAVLNTNDGRLITTVPIGSGTDAAAYDSETHIVFVSNGGGTLTVIKQEGPDQYTVLENAKTEEGARTMALDPKMHRVFLSLADRTLPPPVMPGETAPKRPAIKPNSFRVLVVGKE